MTISCESLNEIHQKIAINDDEHIKCNHRWFSSITSGCVPCSIWVSIGPMWCFFISFSFILVSCLVQINLLPPNECCKWSSIYTINKWSLFCACNECKPIEQKQCTINILTKIASSRQIENLSMPMKRCNTQKRQTKQQQRKKKIDFLISIG